MFLLLKHEKSAIYSKLMNNTFKVYIVENNKKKPISADVIRSIRENIF